MSEKNPFGNLSYPYAVGRVRARESSLLDKAQWSRILDADEAQAAQALREFGYGASEHGPASTVEEMISAELSKTAEFIAEVTPDREFTDLFLLPADGRNLKILLKARLLGTDSSALLTEGGVFPSGVLKACVEYEDFSILGEAMQKELSHVAEETNPRRLSAAVDRAVAARISEALAAHPCEVLNRYFATWSRYANLLADMRSERLGWDEENRKLMRIPVSGVRMDDPDNPPDLTEYPEVRAGETLRETEHNRDRALLKVLREAKGDAFGIAPIISFLLEKQNEARNLRVVFAAKRAGLSVSAAELGDF